MKQLARLNILGSVPPAEDKDPVRTMVIRSYLRKDVRNWIDEFRHVSKTKDAETNVAVLRTGPDEAADQFSDQADIDLLVCFINRLEPGLATKVQRLLYDSRISKMLILTHMRTNLHADWTNHFGTVPAAARREKNVLVPADGRMMGTDRLQIREMDFYKSMDMRILVDELLLKKNFD